VTEETEDICLTLESTQLAKANTEKFKKQIGTSFIYMIYLYLVYTSNHRPLTAITISLFSFMQQPQPALSSASLYHTPPNQVHPEKYPTAAHLPKFLRSLIQNPPVPRNGLIKVRLGTLRYTFILHHDNLLHGFSSRKVRRS
jgi:hypothetical protein